MSQANKGEPLLIEDGCLISAFSPKYYLITAHHLQTFAILPVATLD